MDSLLAGAAKTAGESSIGWNGVWLLLRPLTIISQRVIISAVIRAFKDKEAEKVFNGRFSKKLPHNIQRIAERKLIMLHRSSDLNDLRVPPSNRLEALKGDRTGQHSIRINVQWRICFEWREDGVYEVEIVDYH